MEEKNMKTENENWRDDYLNWARIEEPRTKTYKFNPTVANGGWYMSVISNCLIEL